MSSWMNEAAAIPNHASNGFPHMGDPNNMAGAGMMDPSAFMANNNQFNPGAGGQQFPNPQQIAVAMQNGQMRNASPSFANPVYQTNSVIPSKRPRPREDSIGASPRQNPGMLPTSRADTPQQSQFPGFQPNAIPPQNSGQSQHYPHLQPNGSATASPSPVMAGNQLRPGSVPQRVNTASPHPFSPASQQFGQQASPVPSEHSNTPQPGMYMGQGFPQGYNPTFAPSPSPARPPSAQNPMTPQMAPHQMGQQMPQMHPNQMFANQQMQQMHNMQQMQHAQAAQAMQGRGGMDPKMMYHMRLQQQYGQANMPAGTEMQSQNMGQNRGMMPKQGMPIQNGQIPPGGMRPQQAPQMTRNISLEMFMKNLTNFMASRQLPLDLNPVVENRQLHLFPLFQVVQKFNGYRNVTTHNLWPQVAASIGFSPQMPSAPSQIKMIYERNLVRFEEAWMSQRSHQMKMQATGAGVMATGQVHGTPQRMAQLSPSQNMQPTQPQIQAQSVQSPVKSMMPGMQHGNMNGFSASPHPQTPQQPNSGQGPMRNSIPRGVDAPTVNSEFPIHSPSPANKPGAVPLHHPNQQADIAKVNGTGTLQFAGPLAANQDVYSPLSRALAPQQGKGSWGGLEVGAIDNLGNDLARNTPDMPSVPELGNIDLHALTKSIQSRIHGEVRLALDVLASVTSYNDPHGNPVFIIELGHCEDLLDSLLDCAEDQIDLLAENAEPISDEIDLTSYEDVLRAARAEQFYLRKVPVFGDPDYVLERAADRLIAITTILRNLSFADQNQLWLADEVVVKFFCNLIRSLGTHESLLRTAQNTLDIMKDIMVFLSNIAASVELPGRDQAFCLLQFILSFAPSPTPCMTADKLVFSPFDPSIHKYLPYAVDALAKLLARDEPNRTHYKTMIATDALSPNPYELLTRTFALVVSPIPHQSNELRPGILPLSVESRKPVLMQGFLAADIIAQLAPGYEAGVTRAWLSSGDGFAQKLLTLVKTICQHLEHPVARPGSNMRGQHRDEKDLHHIIIYALSALRRLSEKARDPNNVASIIPHAPATRANLVEWLSNLKDQKLSPVLNQLSAYVGLEN
ncbi:hypothetical protein F4825DRAFT_308521 [Nemania diffusa]|nr:hypothetical protein F4825DRAFT_308521 [Nemania diffusa]